MAVGCERRELRRVGLNVAVYPEDEASLFVRLSYTSSKGIPVPSPKANRTSEGSFKTSPRFTGLSCLWNFYTRINDDDTNKTFEGLGLPAVETRVLGPTRGGRDHTQ